MDVALENEEQPAARLLGGGGRRWALGWPVMGALLAGLALRLWWVWHFGQTTNDTRVYGEFALNMLRHGVYGWTNVVNGVMKAPQPTLIRLPGYPLFLAACFVVFGMENYIAVMLVQVAMDLWTCLLLGGIAARIFGKRTGIAALWVVALCPFMANYVAAPLTETPTLWCIALAFYALVRWRESGAGLNRWIFAMGFALAYAVLLRPEQGLLAAAVVPAVFLIGYGKAGLRSGIKTAVVVSALTVLPLVPWTVRNWRVMHVFQPLAPRYATDPGERINYGFQRWFRTWGVEFASTETAYWPYDGEAIQIADLPNRAFDSNAQYAETEAVLAAYNLTGIPTAVLDAQFEAIAEERIKADPVRYYVVMPVARVVDMTFRPRTELLPIPAEWWKFTQKDYWKDWFALAYAGLNAAFFAAAGWTVWRRRWWIGHRVEVWAMLATIGLRVAILLTVDNSEARYTVEFYPVLIVLGSAVVARAGITD